MRGSALLLVTIAFFGPGAFALVNCNESPSMESYDLGGGVAIHLIPGVERVRGVLFGRSWSSNYGDAELPLRDARVLCKLWRFACLTKTPGGTASSVKALLKKAATETGHAELANAPFVGVLGGRGGADDAVSEMPDRCIAWYKWAYDPPEAGSANTMRIYGSYECRNEDAIPAMPGKLKGLRSQGLPVAYAPIWGYPRGGHNIIELVWPLYDYAIRQRLGTDPVPADGRVTLKPLPSENEGWLGDPSTWYAEWPEIYPFADYTGNAAEAAWLPTRYLAHVWKAAVCRDPELTQQEAGVWGEIFKSDHAGQSHTCSAQPQLGIVSPVRHYGEKACAGSPILVPRDTVVKVRAQCDYDDMTRIELFEGDRKFATFEKSAYGIYIAPCTLSTPGVRSLIVHATLSGGKKITSRPAMIFVDEEPTTGTGSLKTGNRPRPFAVIHAFRSGGSIKLRLSSTGSQNARVSVRDLAGRSLGAGTAVVPLAAGAALVDLGAAPGVGAAVVTVVVDGRRESFVVGLAGSSR